MHFESADAVAATIDHFSDCVIHDRQPESDGVEGLQDVRLIEAIYRSGRDGRPVTLPRLARVESAPVEPSLRPMPLDRREAG